MGNTQCSRVLQSILRSDPKGNRNSLMCSGTDKSLRLTVWAEYSRMDRKVLLGAAQLRLSELRLTGVQPVEGHYRLFSGSALLDDPTALPAEKLLIARSSQTAPALASAASAQTPVAGGDRTSSSPSHALLAAKLVT